MDLPCSDYRVFFQGTSVDDIFTVFYTLVSTVIVILIGVSNVEKSEKEKDRVIRAAHGLKLVTALLLVLYGAFHVTFHFLGYTFAPTTRLNNGITKVASGVILTVFASISLHQGP